MPLPIWIGLPKFSPEPQFKPWTSEPDLRFSFGLVLVHRSASWSSSWFLTGCSIENQFWTSLNHEPHSGDWFWLWVLKQDQSVANIEEEWDVKIWQELILRACSVAPVSKPAPAKSNVPVSKTAGADLKLGRLFGYSPVLELHLSHHALLASPSPCRVLALSHPLILNIIPYHVC